MKSSNKILKTLLASTLVFAILLSSGCSKQSASENQTSAQENSYITRTLIKLNTVVTVSIYDKQDEALLDGVMEVCDYYEEVFSRTSETAELYKFNHGLLNTATDGTNRAELSPDLAGLIRQGITYGDLSKGKFDIAIAPLSELWDFTAENPKVPSKEDINALLPHVNYKDIKVDGNVVTLADETMGIDLGAIAKGYIADRMKEYLIEQGVKSAMINLGGNVLCVGSKPDGTPFNIGIQKPFADRNETIAIVGIDDLSVVSSGIYERSFTVDDTFYHHILNPSTGYPYDTDLVAVTIISEKSVDGDGLSTSCFGLGLEEGLELINSLENTYAVFITSDYELHYSDGFFEHLTVVEQ